MMIISVNLESAIGFSILTRKFEKSWNLLEIIYQGRLNRHKKVLENGGDFYVILKNESAKLDLCKGLRKRVLLVD